MKRFQEIDRFNISGRGLVITVKIPNPKRLMIHPEHPKVGEIVEIDQKKYSVRGVECARILIEPPFVSEYVGLLVIEQQKEGKV